MPNFEFTSPEGKMYTVTGPEGATHEQAFQMLQTQLGATPAAEAKPAAEAPGMLANIAAGAIKGASRIGDTLLTPVDALARKLGIENSFIGRNDRGAAVDQFMGERADPQSIAYQGGDLAAQIAGTAGAGGVLAKGVQAVSQAPRALQLAEALRTGGMAAGGATGKAGMLTRMAGGAGAGATQAAMIDPEHAATGAVVGGALPPIVKGAGAVGGAIAKGIRGGAVSPEVVALAQRAKALGIDIPADRLVNSKPMNAVASALNYVPFSGRAATEAKMESQLTQAASRLIGQNSNNMAYALRKASGDLGAKFDDVLKNNSVTIDKQFFTDLADIHNTAAKELGSDGMKAIAGQIDEIISKGANGQIDGQAAYNIKRTLDRISRRPTPEAFHALEMKKSLMGALDRSIGPDAAADFAKTRQQYGNMIALEKIAKNGVEGDISVARLANMNNINNGPLQEIADIAAQFVKPRESQHGAMQRAVAGLTGATLAGPVGLATASGVGKLSNLMLNSNAARNFVQDTGGGRLSSLLNKPETMQAISHSAPVLALPRR